MHAIFWRFIFLWRYHLDGLVHERRNSIANTLELRLSCTYPPIYFVGSFKTFTNIPQNFLIGTECSSGCEVIGEDVGKIGLYPTVTKQRVNWYIISYRWSGCIISQYSMLSLSEQMNQYRKHYSDVIMSTMASQITVVSVVYSTDGSGEYQRNHLSSASLAFVRGIHRWPVNSPHKRPVTRKMFPFDDVIMSKMGTYVTESCT